MSENNIFIFGAGYSGKAFARARPDQTPIAGTTRSPAKFLDLVEAGIAPHRFDGELAPETLAALETVTHLVISTAPDEAGDPVLNAARQVIAQHMPALRWIGYLSTVGVYGDHGGAWVDETAECRPQSRRSVMRLETEKAWQDLGKEIGRPVAVLRLSGIYGPGRNALVNLANGTARRLIKEGQVFNRIHGEDIAGALWHLIAQDTGGVFNVTDDLPAPPQDVVTFAANLMGIEPPPEVPFETAQLSPMARSFYGENKRVSNAAIKAAGYQFHFPDYKKALERMWTASSWCDGEGRNPIRQW